MGDVKQQCNVTQENHATCARDRSRPAAYVRLVMTDIHVGRSPDSAFWHRLSELRVNNDTQTHTDIHKHMHMHMHMHIQTHTEIKTQTHTQRDTDTHTK